MIEFDKKRGERQRTLDERAWRKTTNRRLNRRTRVSTGRESRPHLSGDFAIGECGVRVLLRHNNLSQDEGDCSPQAADGGKQDL